MTSLRSSSAALPLALVLALALVLTFALGPQAVAGGGGLDDFKEIGDGIERILRAREAASSGGGSGAGQTRRSRTKTTTSSTDDHIRQALGDLGLTSGCEFRCPGGLKYSARPNHTPEANGCGTGPMRVPETLVDFTPCCNEHDVCYHTCGSSKAACDNEFTACMDSLCHSSGLSESDVGICHAQGRIFGLAVAYGGCTPYLDSQGDACLCHNPEDAYKGDL
ncbi:group XIIA secretory phospholipase A2 [Thecamonas trahens ATCC 50062]|uniref:Group XIIA secretory phospholipase A2 n=1 Tax=Thecamonas trahens ATCC 50062 TaxID=461836 RepID=A0A0L0DN24_THETB|nr:group XIIA secretory phospholipase A2 [Thecamonas trahens ATCC 50062]KNC53426.1 group XIIA secretory phospholipase A2 [Thecamonas trahens ATCC 50062]|eukprot:XP_013754463.1 group XIIA secretory phospholipase A2 [Thecamonas trahens ATCC 50062]